MEGASVDCGEGDGAAVAGGRGVMPGAGVQDATRNSETKTSKASFFNITPGVR